MEYCVSYTSFDENKNKRVFWFIYDWNLFVKCNFYDIYTLIYELIQETLFTTSKLRIYLYIGSEAINDLECFILIFRKSETKTYMVA